MHETNEVWVIDDDKSIRWVLEKALKKADIDVSLLKMVISCKGDMHRPAILSDVRMPGIDGFELLKIIKKNMKTCPYYHDSPFRPG